MGYKEITFWKLFRELQFKFFFFHINTPILFIEGGYVGIFEKRGKPKVAAALLSTNVYFIYFFVATA